MTKLPKLEVLRTNYQGKPAAELVIRNATPELRSLCDSLGILPTPDMANRRGLICTNQEALEVARKPFRAFFDNRGEYTK